MTHTLPYTAHVLLSILNFSALKHYNFSFNLMWLSAVLAVTVLINTRATAIDHDKVQPFPQPQPITFSEKAAVKFKPSLAIKSGCHPYPAVNAAGEISAGLKGRGPLDGECEGSSLGSQVYSRSTWYKGKWAIMYAWYFPKDMKNYDIIKKGVRHDWANLVVWLDNPAIAKPTILATSAQNTGYVINKPPKRSNMINDTTTLLKYEYDNKQRWHGISHYHGEGEYQDLIQWNQLTDVAREALEYADFGGANVPFNDAYFETNLNLASTVYVLRSFRHGGTTTHSIWD